MNILTLGLDTCVGWLGANAPRSLPDELCGWQLIPVKREHALPKLDFMVIETQAFATLRECERFAAQLACPVLYMTPLADLANLVNNLPPKDDVCLTDTPLSLLAARLGKLHQTQRSMVDPLTGTHRREAFFGFLRQWSMQSRHDDPLSLLLIDLDHFKLLNDQFGTEHGDDVLQRMGGLLRQYCDDSLMVARLGGQEFAVVVMANDDEAAELAEGIREQVASESFSPNCPTSVSIGVASRRDVKGMDELPGVADEAVYAAKAAGRNRVCVYSGLTTQSLLNGDDLDLINLENKSRVLGERVTNFVTQRSRRILQNLRSEAETDGLTRFYTRRYLDRRLEIQFRHHQGSGQPLSVALIDLDHFGLFNKEHGWPTGDKALRTLCDVIRNNIRLENDWVGRYGGEEFCVVLPGVALEDAITVCERLRVATAATALTSTAGHPLQLTLSVGVVQCDACDQDTAGLLERLSQQTIRAKESGRNRVCWAPYRAAAPITVDNFANSA